MREHNLPLSLTSFVGREREVGELTALLESGRLVTVTGVPGVGKSRLALETGRALSDRYEHGVWHANLASSSEPGVVREIVGDALGLVVSGVGPATMTSGADGRAKLREIIDYARDRDLLLILDDAEHAAEEVASLSEELLRAAPRVRMLVTSRLPLGVPGELVWHAPLLSVPEPDATLAEISNSQAVRLFVDRATAVERHFVLDEGTAPAVARIARRLDGNPLSIELAAARANILTATDLADRLEDSFDLLTRDGAGEDGHHQTLRAAIDWGYELLTDNERHLFDRLSVFRGNFTLEAAEAVCAAPPITVDRVIDLLASLVTKSMVIPNESGADRTYRLGDTLQSYAAERLELRRETGGVQAHHAFYHLAVVEALAPQLRTSLEVDVLRRLERTNADLMEALRWCEETGNTDAAIRFVAVLYLFWFAHRHHAAYSLVRRLLTMEGPRDLARARATIGAGLLGIIEGDFDAGADLLDTGIGLAQELGDAVIEAEGRMYRGVQAQQTGDLSTGASELEWARRAFEEEGESWGVAWVTWFLGMGEMLRGNLDTAYELTAFALEMFRSVGSKFGIANTLATLGRLSRLSGDPQQAIRLHEESLAMFTELGDREGRASVTAALGIDLRDAGHLEDAADSFRTAHELAAPLGNTSWSRELHYLEGDCALAAGDLDRAEASFREALVGVTNASDKQSRGAAHLALEGMTWHAYRTGRMERSVTLFGALDVLPSSDISQLPGLASRVETERFFADDPPRRDEPLTAARARLGTRLYQSLWSAGGSMSLAGAIGYALSAAGEERPTGLPEGLTLAEVELGARVVAQLEDIGERREVRVVGIRVAGRRRRPSGERAALPRHLRATGKFWLLSGIAATLLWISLFAFPDTRNWWEARDLTVNRWFVDLRVPLLTDLALGIHVFGSFWFFRALRWAMLATLIVVKRWRHFFAALVVFLVAEAVIGGFANSIGRPRPFVEVVGSWRGFSHPSAPVAALSATMAVMGYALLPRGKNRNRWMTASGVAVGLLIVARVYLGVDHLTDGVVGAVFGIATAVVVFRLLVPDSAFPVVYRRGTTAHLDITGSRGEAIRRAVSDQLGLEIIDMEPFGLEGSGGSTPIRLKVAGDPDTYLFAKLYATNHLRADRWYKIGRTILYGALEDEVRFSSVRQLVEYEDYMLLRMRQADVPSAQPYGFVEITPEREYLIVTEFLQDASEISDVELDDAIIDDALLMVRRLWDAGLAHRDIKPANVLVRDGQVRLIDAAFGTIRPSPWRQAVDLANMMIILGLQADADRVYQRALRYFAPGDIAEAFAATKSVTIPSQSRSNMRGRKRRDGVDVIEAFRSLAPKREPIAIQRWGRRRIGLTVSALLAVALLFSLFLSNLTGGGFI